MDLTLRGYLSVYALWGLINIVGLLVYIHIVGFNTARFLVHIHIMDLTL